MKNCDNKTILIGIGNCGREDDGLGWAFLDEIKSKLPSHFDVEYRYQLQIEDAELISHYDAVYFIDAHKDTLENGFNCEKCIPVKTHHFSSHELPPETILFLAESIYDKKPESLIIGISGESFNLNIGLTEFAQQNLKNAVSFFEKNQLHISSLQAQ
ncbi:MAG: hydrogenase maturation protease [Flavobacteriaceae bacterium]|nr:hydrogenase maturation protease [Flavobacteriaceae bacterium]